jgi:hypothetical protein
MSKNYIVKSLLLLSVLSLGQGSFSHAMEEAQPLTAIDAQFYGYLALTESHCFALMKQGENASSPKARMQLYNSCAELLREPFSSYKLNYKDSSFSIEDRALAIETFYRISQTLYGKWRKTVNLNSQEALKIFLPTLLDLVDIDNLIFLHLSFLPRELLRDIKPDLATFNSLAHITTLLTNFIPQLSLVQRKQYFDFASQYFDKVTEVPEFQEHAKNHMAVVNQQRAACEKRGNKAKLGKKGQHFVDQKHFEQQGELARLAKKAQEAQQFYNPTASFLEIIALKNQASNTWEVTRDVEKYLAAQKLTYQKLIELETIIAKKLGLKEQTGSRSLDEYTQIYAELVQVVTLKESRTRLPEFITISQNAGDIDDSLLRLTVTAQLLDGSTETFESVPNSLKEVYAVLKYCKGEPEAWDKFREKLEMEKQKKQEARNRQKQKKRSARAQVIISQAEEERNRATSQPLPALPPPPSPAKKPIATTGIPDRGAFEMGKDSNETAQIKKIAAAVLTKNEARKEKKKGKNHAADESLASKPAAVQRTFSETSSVSQPNVVIEKTVVAAKFLEGTSLKLYQSLYSLSPKLTQDGALQLLDSCGLTVNKKEGKGSHAKGTLIAGETILDRSGKVIWTCPDLGEENMMIVPRWDGQNIPPYMIKNLRYLLEKIGITPTAIEISAKIENNNYQQEGPN